MAELVRQSHADERLSGAKITGFGVGYFDIIAMGIKLVLVNIRQIQNSDHIISRLIIVGINISFKQILELCFSYVKIEEDLLTNNVSSLYISIYFLNSPLVNLFN